MVTQPNRGHRLFAALYDSIERLNRRRTDELRRAVAGAASGTVLELGCGTGGNFPFYTWSQLTSLDATEPDPFMLKRATAKLAALPPEIQAKVHLYQVGAEKLPFPAAHFDSIVSTLVLCTVGDPAAALAEARRVLKPTGRLLLVEHIAARGLTYGFQRTLQPLWGHAAGGCQLTRHTEAALAAAGFTLQVEERLKLAPFIPAFRGVATLGVSP